jgi:hypothetical protein
MSKQIPWDQRYPDYGIPFKVLNRNSWAERVLGYAFFVRKIRPSGIFSYEDYCSFRVTSPPKKEMFTNAIKKLATMGFIQKLPNGQYSITAKGLDGYIRVSKRNANRRSLRGED